MKTNQGRGFRANKPRYKGGTGFSKRASLSGMAIDAVAAFDFSNGHRGMARSVQGAKKFVNSRFRFHENGATKALVRDMEPDDPS